MREIYFKLTLETIEKWTMKEICSKPTTEAIAQYKKSDSRLQFILENHLVNSTLPDTLKRQRKLASKLNVKSSKLNCMFSFDSF